MFQKYRKRSRRLDSETLHSSWMTSLFKLIVQNTIARVQAFIAAFSSSSLSSYDSRSTMRSYTATPTAHNQAVSKEKSSVSQSKHSHALCANMPSNQCRAPRLATQQTEGKVFRTGHFKSQDESIWTFQPQYDPVIIEIGSLNTLRYLPTHNNDRLMRLMTTMRGVRNVQGENEWLAGRNGTQDSVGEKIKRYLKRKVTLVPKIGKRIEPLATQNNTLREGCLLNSEIFFELHVIFDLKFDLVSARSDVEGFLDPALIAS